MTEIRFEGKLDRRIHVEAQRLFMKPGRVLIALMIAVVAVSVRAAIGAWLVQDSRPRGEFLMVVVLSAVVVWLILVWLGQRIWPIVIARRTERTSRTFGTPLKGSATESGLHIESAFGASDLPWDVFYRFKMTDSLVLVYQSAQMMNVFPRSFFSGDEDW